MKTAAAIVGVALLACGISYASTQRKVTGVITEVEAQSLSIQPQGKRAVSGKLDAAKTRVTIDGRAATPADLKIAYDAKAELGLDDVWLSVRARAQ